MTYNITRETYDEEALDLLTAVGDAYDQRFTVCTGQKLRELFMLKKALFGLSCFTIFQRKFVFQPVYLIRHWLL